MNLRAYEKSRWLFRILRDFYLTGKNVDRATARLLLKMLEQDTEFFRYNKLLVALADLCRPLSCNVDILNQRLHRYKIYHEEIKRISRAMISEGVNFVFIKTITVFPKDIADIDILVHGNDDLTIAENILKNFGYSKRKKSQAQHLWSLRRNNVIVDVELHTTIAAAGYEYYPKDIIFRNSVELDEVKIPSPLNSILLNIAHCVVKDLYVTLADLLDFYLTLSKYNVDLDQLISFAKDIGLSTPLYLFLYLIGIFNKESYEEINYLTQHSFLRRISVSTDWTEMPLRPSIVTLILSYLEITAIKLKYKPLIKVLRELLSLPQGKGIDTLLYYIIGRKPLVKKFSE
ncbi:MAG: nucleotidyltransferase family protein [Desulfurococcaceae archaeon]